jgi:heme A synthase
MGLGFFHGRIATAFALFALIAGVYGLVEYVRKKQISPSYWGILVVGNLMAAAQGALGAWMALGGLRPERGGTHYLYGVVALLWIPLIPFINKSLGGRHEMLICALVSLAEFGIALRAIVTG